MMLQAGGKWGMGQDETAGKDQPKRLRRSVGITAEL
jgi:hypothetical protein